MSCERVAPYSFTGTFTSPKVISPLHIARMPHHTTRRGRAPGTSGRPTARPSPPGDGTRDRGHSGAMATREQQVEIDGRRLKLSNLDKVLYPQAGTTKGEVIDYYHRIAPVMVPQATRRPATRKRWVDGVGTAQSPGKVFFRKDLES